MATNSLNPLRHHRHLHHHHRLRRRNSLDSPSSLFLKPTAAAARSLSSRSLSTNTTTTFSLSPTTSSSSSSTTTTTDVATSTTPSPSSTSLDLLERHLGARDFRQADEETRRLLIALAGDAAVKRGYVFFSEVQFIPAADLKAIDDMWRRHSDDRFGYSVQKRLWDKAKRDFTRFFIKVGWMKKLDTEVEQYNYRSFPTEFTWELKEDTPEGHLPLTNALRGTQLLNNILAHPAFAAMEEEEAAAAAAAEQQADSATKNGGLLKGLKDENASSKPQPKRVFKSDYSF